MKKSAGPMMAEDSKPSKHMLGDKAYDSAELCEELHERETKVNRFSCSRYFDRVAVKRVCA